MQELQLRAQELQFLARDFVSLGRLQSERLLLTRKQSDLNEIVREAVRAIADKPRVIITLGAEAPVVEADVDRLRQAIESVVRSALQHSSEYVNVAVRADAQFRVGRRQRSLSRAAARRRSRSVRRSRACRRPARGRGDGAFPRPRARATPHGGERRIARHREPIDAGLARPTSPPARDARAAHPPGDGLVARILARSSLMS